MAFLKKISSVESDADLVKQYKSGNNLDKLGELYYRYMDLLYGVCLSYMKDSEEAKDCVLNIFEELTTKVKKYEIDNFKGWLYQLAKNHCLMKLRTKKGQLVNVDAGIVHLHDNVNPDEVIDKEINMNAMEYCIERLPAEQKEAITLFYLQEKCYKEIADITGTDINKVRSFIQNGRRNLKICIEKQVLERQDK